MQDIPKLNVTVKGIITAGHITDAIYRGNPHYKRETRIKNEWKKWETAIKKISLLTEESVPLALIH